MPVSHFGLPVSDIRAATHFYLAALEPLGYKYVGTQADSVGLGVRGADFFLTQSPDGRRPAPTHVAFAAKDRSQVRHCYDAAIKAGGHPSGAPDYRSTDCSCYNAAIEDYDGNTVEFILRMEYQDQETSVAARYPQARREEYSRPRPRSYASESIANEPRAGVLQRSRTEPMEGMSSKAMLGTMFGAAAGVAFAIALTRSAKNDREDSRLAAFASLRGRESDTRSRRRSASAAVSHRNYSTTESRASRAPPPSLSAAARRAIDSRSYHADSDDDEIYSFHRRRTTEERGEYSRTLEETRYGPSRTSRRAITMPEQDQLLLEGPRRSRHSSRRGSIAESKASRHDSVISRTSSRYRKEDPASTSQVSTVKPVRRNSSQYESAAGVPLPPSLAPSRSGSKMSVSKPQTPLTYYLSSGRDRALDDDDDGLGDTKTLGPDDSISCVGLPTRTPRYKVESIRFESPATEQMAIRSKVGSVLRSTRDRSRISRQ